MLKLMAGRSRRLSASTNASIYEDADNGADRQE